MGLVVAILVVLSAAASRTNRHRPPCTPEPPLPATLPYRTAAPRPSPPSLSRVQRWERLLRDVGEMTITLCRMIDKRSP